MERFRKFLEEIRNNPAVHEMLKEKAVPRNSAEEIRAYTDIANKLGYSFTEEEMKSFAEQEAAAQRGKREADIQTIRELPEEELGEVAGGGDTCKSTYKNRENCWKNDGCDNIVNYYDHYVCSWYYYTKCEVSRNS